MPEVQSTADLLATPPGKITAADVRSGLTRAFGAVESNGRYTILFEVSDASGARSTRSADAVIMSCWPSDGLELHGVEIKVSRSDWFSEMRQPKKADAIAKFCDRWWLVTGPGVVKDESEIPPAWGWRLWDGKTLVTKKPAEKTPAEPVSRLFLGSVLRNAGRLNEGMADRARREAESALENRIEERVEHELRRRTPERMGKLMEVVGAFETETGIKITERDTWSGLRTEEGQRVGRMVAALQASGVDGSQWQPGSLKLLIAQLDQTRAAAAQVAAEFGLEMPEPSKRKRGRG